ncbi:competence protein ComEC [Sphaerotilus hippei]|uniref:Competence protein ComEC n=1 Tax=Sphaerotilus hippei TaxID=744406 RepID=A0A318H638_9BURK|nr:DNA internalization-related competence protein ComEC/Rec2 [Sphaerotilus hippei]PXW94733.1 competence protein ComEC [Sphaerotilus hippei]
MGTQALSRVGGGRRAALALGWLGGTGWQLHGASVVPLAASAGMVGLLLLAGVLLHAWCRRRERGWTAVWLCLLLGAGLGWAQTDWRAARRLAVVLPPALEGQALAVVGRVVALPARTGDGVRFLFEIESFDRPVPDTMPRRVMLSWFVPSWGLPGQPAPQDLAAGQRWRLEVRLRQPHGAINPGGFDRELWLFEQDVRATGSVRTGKSARAQRLEAGVCCALERYRQRVREALERRLGDTPQAGVLAALSVGDQSAIDRADWAVFRLTGVAHLMAISGLHITMLAWLAARLAAWGWRRSRRLCWCVPAPLAGAWAGVVLAIAYALLAGWGVPAQRTVCMLVAWQVWRTAGLRSSAAGQWLLAALVVAVADPWALLQAGFWLSFIAVGLLMGSGGVGEGIDRREPSGGDPGPAWPARAGRLVREGLHSQWVASIGLAPWTLLLFQQLSLVGLLANLVAVPVVTWLVTPLALLGLFWSGSWVLAAAPLEGLMAALSWLSTWPWAAWSAPAAPVWASVAGLIGGGLMVAPLPVTMRGVGLLLTLPMLWPAVPGPAAGEFDVLVPDVGQGNAVLVRTATHALLYDTGPAWARGAGAGELILVPLLRRLGVGRLDALVLSHRDSDHTGGAEAVIHSLGAYHLFSSLEAGHALRGRAPHQWCSRGLRWQWDGVSFEFLHPSADLAGQGIEAVRPGRSNARSCVLQIRNASRSVLLTGDMEREQELTLLQAPTLKIRTDVMLVPHHGSRTSSSDEWLRAVKPDVAVVQAGYLNRYGHPAAEVMARYGAHGIGVIRTDSCGAWRWSSTNARFSCTRVETPRYWRALLRGDGPEFAKTLSFDNTEP